MIQEKAKEIFDRASEEIGSVSTTKDLYELKVKYLGKSGEFSLLMRDLGQLSKEDRPIVGKEINVLKRQLTEMLDDKQQALQSSEMAEKLEKDRLDLTLSGPTRVRGSRHPLSLVMEEIVDILANIGFSVRTGPLIESDWYNFEALNIPKDHPARDMQDTFYIDETHVLRTHTSPIQIRTMEKEEPPIRILAPGSVFRCDSDVTHSPNFYQIEGLLIDKEVSMAHLKGTISYFVKSFFGPEIETRFRPSFFPFTEPSAEVDCSCPKCKGEGCRLCSHTGWIEIGGSGLVHPKVIEYAKLDSKKWQGFAFGFGIERMAMIKYGIDDIRLFNENNTDFLSQFI